MWAAAHQRSLFCFFVFFFCFVIISKGFWLCFLLILWISIFLLVFSVLLGDF
jgi:hypothetical protein